MDDDVQQAATGTECERAQRLLDALVAQLDRAFHGHDPQEAKRPIAAKQLRYLFAMRAVGDLLKSVGRADLQRPFYELAEALHDQSEGRRHPLFGVDESVRPGRGRPADNHDVWRLRANLCVGICWLEAGGQVREKAIQQTVRAYWRELFAIKRAGTKTLESAIGGWLDLFESPTEADDTVAVALFNDEIAQLEKIRVVLSAAELQDFGNKRIEGVARLATELLKNEIPPEA